MTSRRICFPFRRGLSQARGAWLSGAGGCKWQPENALIVLEGLKGRPIGEPCAEHEISQAQYYYPAS
jgi:hypothetical protein